MPSAREDLPIFTFDMTASDFEQMAWLVEMAAVGCAHENKSAWAAQLFNDARALRERARGN